MAPMSFFEKFPEFVNFDSRKDRGFSPVTAETLDNRHEISLPDWLVNSMSVLDLGSCLGATGQWVLSKGARHYTGVEVQPALAKTSQDLLSQHWPAEKFAIVQQDIREFLKSEIAAGKKYDVVVMIGVIYAFLDIYGMLEQVKEICDYAVIVDSIYPWNMINPDTPIVDVLRWQNINSSETNTAFFGAGSRVSPYALRLYMEVLGFEDKEGLLYPKPLSDKSVHDSYNSPIVRPGSKSYPTPARFLIRFYKTNQTKLRQVADHVVSNNPRAKKQMADAPEIHVAPTWVFDETVARRFQQEAETHIPDYQRVIDLCMDYTQQVFGDSKDIAVVDVGSALGHTMDKYITEGYTNVTGIENSENMIKASKYADRVTLSNTFVKEPYDVVLANWTLHFVEEREQYLKDIFESLRPGGMLMVSDKTDHTIETENLYYDFKRANGVPEDVIQKKKVALIGVLVTKPLTWYLETLKDIGFSDIQVVNSRYMFSTIYARKL